MPWFVRLAVVMVVIPSVVLAMDHLRRRGFPQLPRVRLPSFRRNPVASDGFYHRLAEAIIKGEFRKKPLRRKEFAELFPTQTACPHCRGRRGKSWDIAGAERLVNDVAALARQIKRKRLCLNCLEQLSEIAKPVKEPKKEKPERKKLSFLSMKVGRIRVPSLAQLGVIAFAATALFSVFLSEVRVGGLRLEMWSLFASFALFALWIPLRILRVLFKRWGPPLVMIVSFVVIMLAGLVAR